MFSFKKTTIPLFFFFFLMLWGSFSLWAQSDSLDMDIDSLKKIKATENPSELQEILNEKVNTSSKKALSTRETPSIVSVITEEEIINSGARDLIDVLRMVPGLDFAHDVDFVVGVGLRGSWYGKPLLLIDGVEFNDLLYQSVQLGNHFPVQNIKKVEIIRGPGSAVYGGMARFGVVNIITKKGEDIKGGRLSTSLSTFEHSIGRRNANVAAGYGNEKWSLSVTGLYGKGRRTDQLYYGFYADTFDLKDKRYSEVNPTHLNIQARYKNLSTIWIYDDYYTSNVSYGIQFRNMYADLSYQLKANKKLTFIPRLSLTNQNPWHYKNYFFDNPDYFLNVKVLQTKANITGIYEASRKLNIVFGTEVFGNQTKGNLDGKYSNQDTLKLRYTNMAVFGQALFRHRIANITAGFRYDKHSEYGSALVPRFALTKKIEDFHFKILYSRAFRAPAIPQMYLNENIKPEKSTIYEIELGYQFTRKMILTANFFAANTHSVIAYSYQTDDNGNYTNETFLNGKENKVSGMEAEYRYKSKKAYLTINYSFYRAGATDTLLRIKVQDKPLFMAFPAHKVHLNAGFLLTPKLHIAPTLTWGSKRYSYGSLDSTGTKGIMKAFDPYLLANIFVRYTDLFTKGLEVGIGIYDIFSQKPPILQAYHGFYAPIPAPSTEFALRLTYQFQFKK